MVDVKPLRRFGISSIDERFRVLRLDGGKMVLGALLYATGGGVAPGGGPAKLGQCTVKFTTYLQNGERVIETDGLESKSRRPATVDESQDFYGSLFWTIAEITGVAGDLQ